MPDLLLGSIEYGGYISITKLIIFLVLFFSWLPLLGWVYTDAEAMGSKKVFWTAIVLGTGAAAAIIWLLVPLFIVGTLFYLIAVGVASISYVMHRNAKVLEPERVLTAEHIKGLFTSEKKKLEGFKGFIFITANNNEVPVPQAKTPDFFGYKTACDIFTDAAWRRASNIIFSPTPQDYNVIYHIDGAALKQPSMLKEQMEYFVHFVKNLADLDTNEKRKPQKGKFRTRQDKEDTEWELATAGSTAGEQIRLKRIAQQDIKKLADINLTPEQYEQLNRISELKQGLFIISGPQKTGVTTTLCALLRNHDAFTNSISTLEKQPSAELPNVTQNVFTLSDTGTTTYAKRLQAIIRMGLDIVGVAECQDSETAQTICAAAKDGKIVYAILKAESVTQALGKWMKLVGDRNLATEALLGISNQRLFRKLCDECKQAYEPNKKLLKKFNIPAEKAKVLYRPGKVQYNKHGKPTTCENCQGTGFVDRMAVFEIITINDQLRKAVQQSKSLSEISAHFRGAKMLGLQQQALRRAISGATAINEVVRVFSSGKKQKAKKPEQK